MNYFYYISSTVISSTITNLTNFFKNIYNYITSFTNYFYMYHDENTCEIDEFDQDDLYEDNKSKVVIRLVEYKDDMNLTSYLWKLNDV